MPSIAGRLARRGEDSELQQGDAGAGCPAGPGARGGLPERVRGDDGGQHLTAIPDDVAAQLARAFRHGVILGLGQVKKTSGRKQAPCRDLLECLRDRQDDVLRFTTDLRIPPTSNQAGRDVRPAKTQQKISGRLRSGETTRHRYAIRGYISTAAKHGENVLTAIREAGNPWMPPVPDPP